MPQAREGKAALQGTLQGHQQERDAEQDYHLGGIPQVEAAEKGGKGCPRSQPGQYAGHDGDGDLEKGGGGEGTPLGQTGEGGKDNDDEYVIHRRTGQDHLGDAVLLTVTLLHQPQHFGDDNGGGDRRRHSSHDGCIQQGDPQQPGRDEDHPSDLQAGGGKAHQHGGPPHLFQVPEVQVEPGPGQDDDEGQLPQVG